jgi:hypothetical protein
MDSHAPDGDPIGVASRFGDRRGRGGWRRDRAVPPRWRRGRALIGVGGGHALFLRYRLGGETLLYGSGGRLGSGKTDTGFATEPGVGAQFRIARHAVLGLSCGIPIGLHNYGTTNTETDAELAALVSFGYRR